MNLTLTAGALRWENHKQPKLAESLNLWSHRWTVGSLAQVRF